MPDPVELSPGQWQIRLFLGRDPETGKQIRRAKNFEADGIRRARVEAARIAAEVQAEHAAAAATPPVILFRKGSEEKYDVGAAADWWKLWKLRNRSPTTRKGYRSILDNHIANAPFAGRQVETVKTGDVERWYSGLAVSPATVRRVHAVLTQIFDQCIRDGTLDQNPAALAYKPEARAKPKTHTPVGTINLLLAAAARRGHVRARALSFAALTGLRRGEMCGLVHSAVDLDAGILLVALNVVVAQERFVTAEGAPRRTHAIIKDPKAHQIAAIALGSQATEIAAEQIDLQLSHPGHAADPFLWAVNEPYGEPLHPDTLTNWFVQAAKDAGVRGVTLHDLRHWQGSQVLEVGGTVQDAKERLRHKSLQTTMGYLHADHTKQQVLVDLMPRLELPSGRN